MIDLREVYRGALERCAPERLIRAHVTPDMPRHVVAIGKCAAPLLEGAADVLDVERAFVAIPEGYREPQVNAEVVRGGHPRMTGSSFEAGRRLIRFVEQCDDVLFLISGGGSACVELPLGPWLEEDDLTTTNARLIAAGLPIGKMNVVRKHLSAIKGGRLAARVRGRSVTLVYSDVSSGALADVASGPTLADLSTKGDAIAILERIGGCDRIVARLRDESLPDTVKQLDRSQVDLIADNSTLTSAAVDVACEAGLTVQTWRGQIEMDVAQAAEDLVAEARQLREGELLVAGGELTVVVRGDGLGGRCSELAVRVAIKMSPALRRGADAGAPLSALFASSDGVDGNSGLAGVYLPRLPTDLDIAEAERELARSSSAVIAARIGEAIIIPATGNNLRDLFLLARG